MTQIRNNSALAFNTYLSFQQPSNSASSNWLRAFTLIPEILCSIFPSYNITCIKERKNKLQIVIFMKEHKENYRDKRIVSKLSNPRNSNKKLE